MQPFREAIPSICDLLLVPFEITAVSVLLCWLVDWRALAGIFYVILVVMWQVSLGPSIKRLRDESTVCTDARLRLVGDSADGIRLIKGNSWEDKIERDVTDVRRCDPIQCLKHPVGSLYEVFIKLPKRGLKKIWVLRLIKPFGLPRVRIPTPSTLRTASPRHHVWPR